MFDRFLDKLACKIVSTLHERFVRLSKDFNDRNNEQSIKEIHLRNKYLQEENDRQKKVIINDYNYKEKLRAENARLEKEIDILNTKFVAMNEIMDSNHAIIVHYSTQNKAVARVLIEKLSIDMGDTKDPTVQAVLEQYEAQKRNIKINENGLNTFTLEQRYFVVKLTDLCCLDTKDTNKLNDILNKVQASRKARGSSSSIKCVVVEEDWSIYKDVIEMIEKESKLNA